MIDNVIDCADNVADRPSSTAGSDVWDQHRVALVFAASVFGLTLLFGLVLLLLKCLETSADDHQAPTTTDDRSVAVSLTPADQSRTLLHTERDGRMRWPEKLTELLLKQVWSSPATSRQSPWNCELAAA